MNLLYKILHQSFPRAVTITFSLLKLIFQLNIRIKFIICLRFKNNRTLCIYVFYLCLFLNIINKVLPLSDLLLKLIKSTYWQIVFWVNIWNVNANNLTLKNFLNVLFQFVLFCVYLTKIFYSRLVIFLHVTCSLR